MDAYEIACEIEHISGEINIGVQNNGDDIFTIIGEYNGTRQLYEIFHASLCRKKTKLKEVISSGEVDVPALLKRLKDEGKNDAVFILKGILGGKNHFPKYHVLIVPPSGFPGCSVTGARLKRAGELMENGTVPDDVFIIFPQKDKLGYAMGGIAAHMFPNARVITGNTSWGTWDDTAASVVMARRHFNRTDIVKVSFVTDKFHLIRFRLAWKAFAPKGWTAEFHAVEWNRPTKDYLYEVAAIAKYFWLLLKHKVSK